MNICIYQIHLERDSNLVAFMGYDYACRINGGYIDSSIYDKVFSGDVHCQYPEDVFTEFNSNVKNYRLAGYYGRSMSVSDVLEVKEETGSTFLYVNQFGFKEIDFDPEEAGALDDMEYFWVIPENIQDQWQCWFINKTMEADQRLKHLQTMVGGCIETVSLNGDLLMLVNDEGRLNELKINAIASTLAKQLIFGNAVIAKRGFQNGEPDIVGMNQEELALMALISRPLRQREVVDIRDHEEKQQ